jgi:hypothetical protein
LLGTAIGGKAPKKRGKGGKKMREGKKREKKRKDSHCRISPKEQEDYIVRQVIRQLV